MDATWGSALVFLLLAFIAAAGGIVTNYILRVRAKQELDSKYTTYECGEEPDGDAWIQFHPRYYVVALVFVVFDAEAAFLFPWALSIRELGSFAVIEMFVFLGVLFFGWLYAWKKGALRWQ